MTTIAYRNGVLAGDSACTVEHVHAHPLRKLYRLKDGSLFGFSGDVSVAMRWLEWFDNDDDYSEPNCRGCHIIRVERSGVWFMEDNKTVVPKPTDYYAIGTGSELALGAMAHGAGAVAAVRAACKHDAMSRGPVVSLRLLRSRRSGN